MPSASSAKAGSRPSSGLTSLPPRVGVWDERNELRDGGRSGVVGRGGGVPERVLEDEGRKELEEPSKFVGVAADML